MNVISLCRQERNVGENQRKQRKDPGRVNKNILIQYADMKEEIKDIRRRIDKLQREINNMSEVSDSVTGTRTDGTIGTIRISGFPTMNYYRKKGLLERNKKKLELKEIELLQLTNQAEEFIESIDKSELRIMFRLYFLDDLSYLKVAQKMNSMFPKRKTKYTDENIKKRIQRFF